MSMTLAYFYLDPFALIIESKINRMLSTIPNQELNEAKELWSSMKPMNTTIFKKYWEDAYQLSGEKNQPIFLGL